MRLEMRLSVVLGMALTPICVGCGRYRSATELTAPSSRSGASQAALAGRAPDGPDALIGLHDRGRGDLPPTVAITSPRPSPLLFVITAFDRRGMYDPVFSLSKNMLVFRVIPPAAQEAPGTGTADGTPAWERGAGRR